MGNCKSLSSSPPPPLAASVAAPSPATRGNAGAPQPQPASPSKSEDRGDTPDGGDDDGRCSGCGKDGDCDDVDCDEGDCDDVERQRRRGRRILRDLIESGARAGEIDWTGVIEMASEFHRREQRLLRGRGGVRGRGVGRTGGGDVVMGTGGGDNRRGEEAPPPPVECVEVRRSPPPDGCRGGEAAGASGGSDAARPGRRHRLDTIGGKPEPTPVPRKYSLFFSENRRRRRRRRRMESVGSFSVNLLLYDSCGSPAPSRVPDPSPLTSPPVGKRRLGFPAAVCASPPAPAVGASSFSFDERSSDTNTTSGSSGLSNGTISPTNAEEDIDIGGGGPSSPHPQLSPQQDHDGGNIGTGGGGGVRILGTIDENVSVKMW